MNFENNPEIHYPNKLEYKIIGSNINDMVNAVKDIVADLEYDLEPSNISRKAKYFSLRVLVLVPSEIFRDKIFRGFRDHPAIKFVI